MASILKSRSIYYNDVNLIARCGVINSRKLVKEEKNRIIVSPMPAIVGSAFAKEATKLGLTVCLHRFCVPREQASIYTSIKDTSNVYMSCGLINDLETYKAIREVKCKQIVVDFANGYLPQIAYHLDKIANEIDIEKLIIGNVHTSAGIEYLEGIVKQFATLKQVVIRVGIAGGGPCSTSDMTGINRGNITELIECSEVKRSPTTYIAADGGIKKPGYACKAFGAGADKVIMGQYWLQAQEAQTNISGDGSYWGCASHKNQKLWKGKTFRHSEGKVIEKDKNELKPLEQLVEELWGSIASYVSYSGYSSLSESIGQGVFEIKQNSLPPRQR